jgi:hypothetical protein
MFSSMAQICGAHSMVANLLGGIWFLLFSQGVSARHRCPSGSVLFFVADLAAHVCCLDGLLPCKSCSDTAHPRSPLHRKMRRGSVSVCRQRREGLEEL